MADITPVELSEEQKGRIKPKERYFRYIAGPQKEIDRLRSENVRDAGTGLYNQEYFLNQLAERTKNPEEKITLIMLDMDNLKKLNSEFGHSSGTNVIKGISRILEGKIRLNDNGFAARYGGDEFAMLIPGIGDLDTAKSRAEDVRKSIEEAQFRSGDKNLKETVSVGVGLWDGKESDTDFFNRVDAALYEAKNSGKNKVVESKPNV